MILFLLPSPGGPATARAAEEEERGATPHQPRRGRRLWFAEGRGSPEPHRGLLCCEIKELLNISVGAACVGQQRRLGSWRERRAAKQVPGTQTADGTKPFCNKNLSLGKVSLLPPALAITL